jgi:uncharacterized damage-inducible protein DinB
MSISETMLPEFDHEMASTRKILERVPDDKLAWKPHAKSMALGRLAGHLADLPLWVNRAVEQPLVEIEQVRGQAYTAGSRDDLLKTFDRNVAGARQALAGAADDTLRQTWSLKAGGKVMLSMPRLAAVRSVFMNHLIHHRGQLSVYLRLNDVAVPGLYGPSADEGLM